MREIVVPVSRLPLPNSTVLIHRPEPALGGAAVNVAWYLASLGHSVDLRVIVGRRDRALLADELSHLPIDLENVFAITGDSDHLLTLLAPEEHLSTYVLANLDELETFGDVLCYDHDVVILNGGRHAKIRNFYCSLIDSVPAARLVFNPSYAIYEYDTEGLSALIEASGTVVVNEDELEHCQTVGVACPDRLRSEQLLYVTRGHKGATLFTKNDRVDRSPKQVQPGLFLGAGDAFVAGIASVMIQRQPPTRALEFGMTVAAAVVKQGRIRAVLEGVRSRNQSDESSFSAREHGEPSRSRP